MRKVYSRLLLCLMLAVFAFFFIFTMIVFWAGMTARPGLEIIFNVLRAAFTAALCFWGYKLVKFVITYWNKL